MILAAHHFFIPTLAAGGEGELWGVIFALLIAFSHVLGSIAKAKQKKKPVIVPPEKSRTARPQPLRRPPAQNRPVPTMRPKRPIGSAPARPPQLPRPPVFNTQTLVVPAPAALPVLATQPQPLATVMAIPSTPQLPVKPSAANSIHKWLQPEKLRRQFILTEIFQPPLALRENPFN